MPAPAPAIASDHRHAVAASFLGWTLDAFDFFIVTFVLTDIGKEFGRSRVEMAGVLTMTLAMRPIGAFIFGLIADRYGRRLPLMIDLVFFSVVEVWSGLVHTYTGFLILRALFGIGMGGEWGVGASLAMEKAPRGRRGLMSGLLQEGYATGNLLAAICYLFVYPHLGWRPMFFIGGIPALLAVYVRFGVKESEVWQRTKAANWGSLGRSIVSHWKLFLYIFLMMMLMNFVSHGTQDLFPTFLKVQKGFDPKAVAYMGIVYNIGAILGGLVVGRYSDAVGRRRAMIVSLLLAVAVIPLWVLAPASSVPVFAVFPAGTFLLMVGAFLMQFMVQGAWGVVPAHINELAPDTVRGFLPGFAYQCGVAVAGVAPTLQEALARVYPMASVMAVSCGLAFVLAALVVALGKERHAAEFGLTGPEPAG